MKITTSVFFLLAADVNAYGRLQPAKKYESVAHPTVGGFFDKKPAKTKEDNKEEEPESESEPSEKFNLYDHVRDQMGHTDTTKEQESQK